VWYFVVFHGCWNCSDSVVFCCEQFQHPWKTTKYHSQDSSKIQ
jgi:hypothetical protein